MLKSTESTSLVGATVKNLMFIGTEIAFVKNALILRNRLCPDRDC
jgi:hypothetical protein